MHQARAGVSGATLERRALKRLIADCRAGKVGVVVTKDSAWLARDTGQLFRLLRIFEAAGVHVQFCVDHAQRSLCLLNTTLCAMAELEKAMRRSKPTR